MSLADLAPAERDVVHQCLTAAASGRIFEDDEDFFLVSGVTLEELRSVLTKWPAVDERDLVVRLAIHGSFLNLLGYPHGREHSIGDYVRVPLQEAHRIFRKWRGEDRRTNADL